ncbi:thiamine pyrophosphate-binding protein [Pseudoroseicyclus tamaricis]|uniref:Thiamine pyrophosphate-binding protein n=1 Tax=Pseudoroseicyclus tamaricis TaxID=2705421 RepID=A0A6B2JVJ3_9RHOB|nr:thiamine pyrophosphate-binding protein [Pseudoroseicyclus tamaricis]NDU99401.1 thiamine pyrophosphate-binding protein [Pseudoroseicyclus tamaricis]
MRHGGQILVDQLVRLGARRAFCVPGESFLAVLDALHDAPISLVTARQEGGAAMMAEAHAKLTGNPGLCFVTRGPGAANAAAGLHVARQDSTPMILFVGQVPRGHKDREAFQEVDYRAAFGGLCKWSAEVTDTARLPEYVARAWHVATAGRPGPVLLALPEDVLSGTADVTDLAHPPIELAPTFESTAQDALGWLAGAERPLIVAGGPHWSEEAAADLGRFATAQGLPVALSFRRQDYLDNRHPGYAGDLSVGGNPKLFARLAEADRVLLLGTRLGENASKSYTALEPGRPGPSILHVHAGPEETGLVWRPDMSVTADAISFIRALARQAPLGRDWSGWTSALRADYEAWVSPRQTPGAVKMEEVVSWLSENLGEEAIVTNGAGNYAAFLHRYFRYRRFRSQLAPTSGSMGYGLPAAITASLEYPDRPVVCMAGDGCLQMTVNELSTAAQYGATPIVVVANNGRYGTIRAHQERTYPSRVAGTDLVNPDFPALARAYGGHGERVERTEDFPAAFSRAGASGTFAIIELMLDPEALSPGQTLSEARAAGEARR